MGQPGVAFLLKLLWSEQQIRPRILSCASEMPPDPLLASVFGF